jgi:hypothetical protein
MHILALVLVLQVADTGQPTTLNPLSLHARSLVHADTTAVPPTATARRLMGVIRLDGTLDEPAWQLAPAVTDLTQRQPDEGKPATQRTEVRFLYDREALYVGARMYDAAGASGVVSRLFRRDGDFESDFLQLNLDTFHDHLGRASFALNPDGVKWDVLSIGGAVPDKSWDPVWDVATTIDSLGWTAELRIPFSQLRFPRDTQQTWGLQIIRSVHRLNELTMWRFFPSTEPGGPAYFGHLEGLTIEGSPAKGEILPYVVARNARLGTADPASPFYLANDVGARVGIDFKYLLTSNLTVTGTVNPDFGQVEVDPAVVNLSAFETYFPEKRPFFVEGSGYFLFGGLSCFFCDGSSMKLLYSRRIGRTPQGAGVAQAGGDFADVPDNATILGAAKVTGRTASGWSVGLLNAVTAREYARVATRDGSQFDTEVEPLSNYFAGRVAKDLLGGDLQVRAMATSVVRDLRDPALAARLARHAEAGGVDLEWWWGGRAHRWTLAAAVSQVAGDSSAMLGVQRSSARYFQRPDRKHGGNGLFTGAYDPGLTAMRGWGVESRLSREAGNWLWEVNAGARSPGFETNDVAFLTRADYTWMSANLVRRRTTPAWLFRDYWLLVGGQQRYNFDGDLVGRQARVTARFTFRNYWAVETFATYQPSIFCDQLTRGGPVVRYPGYAGLYAAVSTDTRKSLSGYLAVQLGANSEGARDRNANATITVRPVTNVSLQLGPSFDHSESTVQYVTAVADPTATAFDGTRYVFSDLTQRTVSMDLRLNVAFTPNLTLDLYMQPLIASGHYSNFKEFDRPRELAKSVYGADIGTISSAGGEYTVDPDGGGPAAPFRLADPDFNFRSLRGNAVLRWEFRPGSTLYFAWTQARSDEESIGTMRLGHDLDALLSAKADHIFLVKLSYWIEL